MTNARPILSIFLVCLLLIGGLLGFAEAETAAAPSLEEYQLAQPENLVYTTYADHVRIIAVKQIAPMVRLPETIDGLPVTEVTLRLKIDPPSEIRALYLPASVTGLVQLVGGNLERVDTDPQNPAYVSLDGRLYSKDLSTLVFAYVAPGTVFVIPEGTQHVQDYAIELSDGAVLSGAPAADDSVVKERPGNNAQDHVSKPSGGAGLSGVSAVDVPASLETFGCNPSLYCDYIVAESNAQFAALNGMLTSKDGKTLYTVNPSCFEAVADENGVLTLAKTMTIPDGITVITAAVFDTSAETLVVPASVAVMDIPAAREGGFVLSAYEVAEDNQAYCAVDGVLYSKDQTTLVSVPKFKRFDAQTAFPEGLTTVAARAVRLIIDPRNKVDMVFPETLRTIEAEAFHGFGFSSDRFTLRLPAGVTTVGENAFTGALTVVCPEGSVVAEAVRGAQSADGNSYLALQLQ